MPTAYFLVGVPASGKSTWVTQQDLVKDFVYVSSSLYVEDEAFKAGTTYSEIFSSSIKGAIVKMLEDVEWAVTLQRDIIWDQTSTTSASRVKKFKFTPDYKKVAVVFKTPDAEEHSARLASRKDKQIPKDVIEKMISEFEIPTLEEGFDEILFV